MLNLGWLKDTHQPSESTAAFTGPESRVSRDLARLFDTYDADYWVHGGDPVHPVEDHRGRLPHLASGAYERFWQEIRTSGHYEDLLGIIPGNHDVPIERFLAADEKACLNKAIHFDDGVSVIMINSVGDGRQTGSPMPTDEPGGWGVGYGFVGEEVLTWLETQLTRAGNNTKLVFSHHHLFFQSDSAFPHVYSPDDTMRAENMYWVVLNHNRVHECLSAFSKVIVFQAHAHQFNREGSRLLDGVQYLATTHYYDIPNDQVRGSYGLIRADRSGIAVDSIFPDGEQSTILDVSHE